MQVSRKPSKCHRKPRSVLPQLEMENDATGPRDADNLLFADRLGSCPAQSAKNEPFMGDFRLYFRGPKTSRNTTLKSSSARAQSPVKLEPCMMASVLGFRSASFFKYPAVSGV